MQEWVDLHQKISKPFSKLPVSGRLQELKNKGKDQLGNPKSGRGRLQLLFITKYKSQLKRGFTRVVVTRAGRLLEWSKGELRVYFKSVSHLWLTPNLVQNTFWCCATQSFPSTPPPPFY